MAEHTVKNKIASTYRHRIEFDSIFPLTTSSQLPRDPRPPPRWPQPDARAETLIGGASEPAIPAPSTRTRIRHFPDPLRHFPDPPTPMPDVVVDVAFGPPDHRSAPQGRKTEELYRNSDGRPRMPLSEPLPLRRPQRIRYAHARGGGINPDSAGGDERCAFAVVMAAGNRHPSSAAVGRMCRGGCQCDHESTSSVPTRRRSGPDCSDRLPCN